MIGTYIGHRSKPADLVNAEPGAATFAIATSENFGVIVPVLGCCGWPRVIFIAISRDDQAIAGITVVRHEQQTHNRSTLAVAAGMCGYPIDFSRRGGAAEYQIAMRKTSEAMHDVAVGHSVLQVDLRDRLEAIRGIRMKLLEARYRFVLRIAILGVLQRDIEKSAFDDFELPVDAHRDAVAAQRQRALVIREGLRRAAINVPRELIERNDKGKRAVRC